MIFSTCARPAGTKVRKNFRIPDITAVFFQKLISCSALEDIAIRPPGDEALPARDRPSAMISLTVGMAEGDLSSHGRSPFTVRKVTFCKVNGHLLFRYS